MMSKVSDAKKIGRPATGVGIPVTVRLHPAQIDALDAWIRQQDPQPTRPEAMRRILNAFIDAPASWTAPARHSGPVPPFAVGDRVRSKHFGDGTVAGSLIALAGPDEHSPTGVRDAGWRMPVQWDAAERGIIDVADWAVEAIIPNSGPA